MNQPLISPAAISRLLNGGAMAALAASSSARIPAGKTITLTSGTVTVTATGATPARKGGERFEWKIVE